MQKNWTSIEHLFCRLNRSSINYIVLRNYESLTDNDIFVGEHDDIDFLCDNIYKMIKLLDARPIYRFPNRNSYMIRFQNRDLQVDVRYVGDGYYDTDWEKALLKRKVIFNNFIYVIDNWSVKSSFNETVDLTVYCRKLVCNSLKSEENMSALFVTRIDIF